LERERLVGGGEMLGLGRLAARGKDGEIFVAAGFAAEGGKLKSAAEEGQGSVNVFGRNSLQLMIAADGTVGMKGIAERHEARVETGMTGAAAPGIEP